MIERCLFRLLAGVAIVLCVTPRAGLANVDLELRPQMQTVFVGDIVEIGLYAVSDDDEINQSVGVVSDVLSWDPGRLQFIGLVNNGDYDWLLSVFVVHPLNDSWLDGDAFHTAWAPFAPEPPAWATPQGLLVTTFRFVALSPGPETVVSLVSDLNGKLTRVLDGLVPGMDVTGVLGEATVRVLECGSSGDMDDDCDVDLDDVPGLVACMTGPENGPPAAGCEPADADGDGDVDLADVGAAQAAFTGPG